MLFVGEHAMVYRLHVEGIEEVCGRGAERTVRVSLERSDTKKWTTESVPYTNLDLVIDTRNQGSGIDTCRQFAAFQQLGVDGDVRVFRIHVLHARHSYR